MKVKVIVTLKSGVLDPQGKAIQQTLNVLKPNLFYLFIKVGNLPLAKLVKSIVSGL